MTDWETNAEGDVQFEPVVNYRLRSGPFGEPSVTLLLLRLELSRRSIQIALSVDEAWEIATAIQRRLSELDQP